MRSISAWGNAVQNLLERIGIVCKILSTMMVQNRMTVVSNSGEPITTHIYTGTFSHSFTQPELLFSHQLSKEFSQLSTAPIITNVKKGFKKQ